MIKKLVTRLDLKGLDALMLACGLIGGLAGSFIAVRSSEHKARQVEVENAVIAAASPHHEAPDRASDPVDAGAPERREVAEHAEHAEHEAEK
jgi:hypothetical protein